MACLEHSKLRLETSLFETYIHNAMQHVSAMGSDSVFCGFICVKKKNCTLPLSLCLSYFFIGRGKKTSRRRHLIKENI